MHWKGAYIKGRECRFSCIGDSGFYHCMMKDKDEINYHKLSTKCKPSFENDRLSDFKCSYYPRDPEFQCNGVVYEIDEELLERKSCENSWMSMLSFTGGIGQLIISEVCTGGIHGYATVLLLFSLFFSAVTAVFIVGLIKNIILGLHWFYWEIKRGCTMSQIYEKAVEKAQSMMEDDYCHICHTNMKSINEMKSHQFHCPRQECPYCQCNIRGIIFSKHIQECEHAYCFQKETLDIAQVDRYKSSAFLRKLYSLKTTNKWITQPLCWILIGASIVFWMVTASDGSQTERRSPMSLYFVVCILSTGTKLGLFLTLFPIATGFPVDNPALISSNVSGPYLTYFSYMLFLCVVFFHSIVITVIITFAIYLINVVEHYVVYLLTIRNTDRYVAILRKYSSLFEDRDTPDRTDYTCPMCSKSVPKDFARVHEKDCISRNDPIFYRVYSCVKTPFIKGPMERGIVFKGAYMAVLIIVTLFLLSRVPSSNGGVVDPFRFTEDGNPETSSDGDTSGIQTTVVSTASTPTGDCNCISGDSLLTFYVPVIVMVICSLALFTFSFVFTFRVTDINIRRKLISKNLTISFSVTLVLISFILLSSHFGYVKGDLYDDSVSKSSPKVVKWEGNDGVDRVVRDMGMKLDPFDSGRIDFELIVKSNEGLNWIRSVKNTENMGLMNIALSISPARHCSNLKDIGTWMDYNEIFNSESNCIPGSQRDRYGVCEQSKTDIEGAGECSSCDGELLKCQSVLVDVIPKYRAFSVTEAKSGVKACIYAGSHICVAIPNDMCYEWDQSKICVSGVKSEISEPYKLMKPYSSDNNTFFKVPDICQTNCKQGEPGDFMKSRDGSYKCPESSFTYSRGCSETSSGMRYSKCIAHGDSTSGVKVFERSLSSYSRIKMSERSKSGTDTCWNEDDNNSLFRISGHISPLRKSLERNFECKRHVETVKISGSWGSNTGIEAECAVDISACPHSTEVVQICDRGTCFGSTIKRMTRGVNSVFIRSKGGNSQTYYSCCSTGECSSNYKKASDPHFRGKFHSKKGHYCPIDTGKNDTSSKIARGVVYTKRTASDNKLVIVIIALSSVIVTGFMLAVIRKGQRYYEIPAFTKKKNVVY